MGDVIQARVGYLAGAFDMFNVGDLDAITKAKSLCDVLIVGVLPDAQVRLSRGTEPVVPLDERLEIVRHMRPVDRVVAHSATDPHEDFGVDVIFVSSAEVDARSTARVHLLDDIRVTESWMLKIALSPRSARSSSVA